MSVISDIDNFLQKLEQILNGDRFKLSKQSQIRFDELKKKVRSEKITICISALTKAGKSTLVNALLGAPYLHVSNIPATSGITFVSHTDTNSTSKLYERGSDGAREKLLIEGTADKIYLTVKKCNEDLRKSAKSEATTTTGASCSESALDRSTCETLELEAPILALSELPTEQTSRIQIVDTPGRNEAANELVKNLSDECMSTADVILFIFNYTCLKTNDEAKMWTQLIQTRPELFQLKNDRIFYIINQFDQYKSNCLNEQQVKEYIQSAVKGYCGYVPSMERMFCVSARDALYTRMLTNNNLTISTEEVADIASSWFPFTYEDITTLEVLKSQKINYERKLITSNIRTIEEVVIQHIAQYSWKYREQSIKDATKKFLDNVIKSLQVTLEQYDQSIEQVMEEMDKLYSLIHQISHFSRNEFSNWFGKQISQPIQAKYTALFTAMKLKIESTKAEGTVQRIAITENTRQKAKIEAERVAKEMAENAIAKLSAQLALVISQFEAEQIAFAAQAETEFQKFIIAELKPLIERANVTNCIMQMYEDKSNDSNFVSQALDVVRTGVRINWTKIKDNVTSALKLKTEDRQEVSHQMVEATYDFPEPVIIEKSNIWSILGLTVGLLTGESIASKFLSSELSKEIFKKPEVKQRTVSKTIRLPATTLKTVSSDFYVIDPEDIFSLVSSSLLNALMVTEENLPNTLKEIIQATLFNNWLGYLMSSTAEASTALNQVVTNLNTGEQGAKKAKDDAAFALEFFAQAKEQLSKHFE